MTNVTHVTLSYCVEGQSSTIVCCIVHKITLYYTDKVGTGIKSVIIEVKSNTNTSTACTYGINVMTIVAVVINE